MAKNYLIYGAKLLFACACLLAILWQLDIEKLAATLSNVRLSYFLGAIVVFLLSQLVCTLRARYYIATVGVHINHAFSVGLYFVGLLFNNILPSGIGGDGYKVYVLEKMSGLKYLKGIRIMLSERANGLAMLCIFAAIIAVFSDIPTWVPYQNTTIMICLLGVLLCYALATKYFLKERPKDTVFMLGYSAIIQLLIIVAFMLVLLSLSADLTDAMWQHFILIFQVSLIAAVIPISIGGAGLRELAMFYGCNLAGLDIELGVAAALLYFVVNVLVSLTGCFYLNRLKRLY